MLLLLLPEMFEVTSMLCVCEQAGANMIVSGSAVVRSSDPSHVMSVMRKAVTESLQKQSHIITDL